MTTSSRNHNPLAMRGDRITDEEYIADWNSNPLTNKYGYMDVKSANTPQLTNMAETMIKQYQTKENKEL